MEETAFDPQRQLCPDGACVGVIGADGRCSVCAAPTGAGTDQGDRAPAERTTAPATDAGFDPGRRLCDDGSCVGVVGPNGACGTCGRKAD